jgi:hypothetical protein
MEMSVFWVKANVPRGVKQTSKIGIATSACDPKQTLIGHAIWMSALQSPVDGLCRVFGRKSKDV